jgi:hypothetical protein
MRFLCDEHGLKSVGGNLEMTNVPMGYLHSIHILFGD